MHLLWNWSASRGFVALACSLTGDADKEMHCPCQTPHGLTRDSRNTRPVLGLRIGKIFQQTRRGDFTLSPWWCGERRPRRTKAAQKACFSAENAPLTTSVSGSPERWVTWRAR